MARGAKGSDLRKDSACWLRELGGDRIGELQRLQHELSDVGEKGALADVHLFVGYGAKELGEDGVDLCGGFGVSGIGQDGCEAGGFGGLTLCGGVVAAESGMGRRDEHAATALVGVEMCAAVGFGS